MGATNRSKTNYVVESTKGTTPTSPAFKELRVTSNSLNYAPTRVTTNEIRSDRQIPGHILTALTAGGNVGLELSFGAHDDMIEAALQGTWVAKATIVNVTADTEISNLSATVATVSAGGASFVTGHLVHSSGFTTTANNDIITRVTSSTATTITFPSTFTVEAAPPVAARLRVVGFQGAAGDVVATVTSGNALTSTLLDFTTLGINVGEWVHVGGDTANSLFATTANNGWCRVSVVAAARLSFDIVPTGWAADSAGSPKTIQVFTGDFISNSTTQRAFTFERQQLDLTSPSYELFKGCQVNTFNTSLKAGAVITATLGLTGMTATVSTTRSSGATDTNAALFDVLNAASNVGEFAEGGTLVSGPSFITELGLDINNNLAEQRAIGSIGSVGIRNGELAVGGTLTAYFGDTSLLGKVLNDTDTSIWFRAGQTTENRVSYGFDIPAVKLQGTADVTAKNQDRMFNGRYDANRHETLGYTIACQRYFYLPVAS